MEGKEIGGLAYVGVRCQYCNNSRNPREVCRMPGGVVMCFLCAEWHNHALKVLAGDIPRGCQSCGITFFSLAMVTKSDSRGNISMRLVVKDGIYQVLCEPCAAAYRVKRKEFYRGTEFGDRLKI